MMTRFLPSLLALALLFAFSHAAAPPSHAAGCTVSWAAAASGFWSDPSRWSPPGVPSGADQVCINQPGDYTVVAAGPIAVASLVHGNPAGTQTLKVVGNNTVASGYIDAPAGITNSGTIVLETADGAWDASLRTGNAPIVNTGRIIAAVGAGGPRTIYGALQNSGQLVVGQSLMLSPDVNGLAHVNSGLIHIAAGQTLEVTGDTFTNNAGVIENLGAFRQLDGAFTLNGGQFTGNPPYLRGTLSYGPAPSHPVTVIGAGGVALASDIPANQTLRVRGDNEVGNTFLTIDGNYTNHGTLVLDTMHDQWGVFAVIQPGVTFTNAGTVTSAVGTGGARSISGHFDNQGTLNVLQPLAITSGGCASTQMTNSGTVNIAAGKTLDIGQGCPNTVFNLTGGAVTGPGTLVPTLGATVNFTGGAIIGAPAVLTSSQLMIGPGSGAAQIILQGAGNTITGNIKPGQTLTVQGNGNYGSASLTANAGLVNGGRLVLDTIGDAWAADLNVMAGPFVNSGTLHVASGAGGARTIYGGVLNNGAVIVDQSLTHNVWGAAPPVAFINNGNLTIAAGQTLLSQGQVFKQAGGELTINGSLMADTGEIGYAGGAVRGANPLLVALNSTIRMDPAGAVKFLVIGSANKIMSDIGAGQTVTVQGNGTYGSGYLTAPNGFTNNGTLNLNTIDGAWSTHVIVPNNKTLVNNGTINALAGAGGVRHFDGPIVNNGTIDVAAQFVPGTTYPATLTNNGTVRIASGTEVTISGGDRIFVQAAGKVTGGGLLRIENTHLNFTGGEFITAPLLLNSRLTLAAGSGNGAFDFQGGLGVLHGNVKSGQTLRLQGNGTYGAAIVTAPMSFVNDGTILLDTKDGAWSAGITVTTGRFTNNGILRAPQGAGGQRVFQAHVRNTGIFSADADVYFTGSSGVGTFANEGLLTLNPGRTLTADGQEFVQAGGTLDVKGQLSISSGIFRFKGGVLSGRPRLTNSTLDLATTTPGSFFLQGSSNSLIGKVAAGQVITLEGNGSYGPAYVTTPNDLLNAGEINLTSANGGWGAQLDVPAGKSITNLGVINVVYGAAGQRLLGGNVINHGAITLSADTLVHLGGSLTNAAAGTISFTGARTLWVDGVVRNNGTVNVGLGQVVAGSGGNDYIQNAGTTDLGGGTLQAANVRIQGGQLTGSGMVWGDLSNEASVQPGGGGTGRIRVTGNYTQAAAGTLGIGIGGTQPASQHDALVVDLTANLGGTLAVSLLNSFTPATGDRFAILHSTQIAGDFAAKTGLEYTAGQFFMPRFGPNGLALEAGAPYNARIQLTNVPVSWPLRQPKQVTVTIANRGSQTLNAAGGNPVRLLAAFVDGGNNVLAQKAVPLAGDIAAGASGSLTFELTAPAGLGATRLQFTLVREGIGTVPDSNGQAITLVSPFKPQTSGTPGNLLAVTALHGNTAWAVGVGGKILKTVNGGAAWVNQISTTSAHLRAVDAADENVAWAVGDNATVRRTTDGGTWHGKVVPTTSPLYGVAAVSAQTAWVVGDSGLILRTDDGGVNWTQQTSGVTGTLYAISAINANVAWAAGSSAILRTVDGGATWELVYGACCDVFKSVTALSETHAWIAGTDGTVMRSVDGMSVQYVGDFNFGQLRSVTARLADPGTAWIVGDDGHIRMTTDGGVSWRTQYVGAAPLYGVSAAGSGVWAVGGGGAILKATP